METLVEILDGYKVSLKTFQSTLSSNALCHLSATTALTPFWSDKPLPRQPVWLHHHPPWKMGMEIVSLLPNLRVELRAIRCPSCIKYMRPWWTFLAKTTTTTNTQNGKVQHAAYLNRRLPVDTEGFPGPSGNDLVSLSDTNPMNSFPTFLNCS